ncbi:MAG: methyltransferase domain-containing protein [Syntrophaceae bacterium]|nr:methyltransferase domain-containing protein [Syntrophaceae bacterium]
MKKSPPVLRWSVALAVVIIVAALFMIGKSRMGVDTDILNAIPAGDPVLADARAVLKSHPMQDRIVADLRCDPVDPRALQEGAALVIKKMRDSGLFRRVGLDAEMGAFPTLADAVVENLPFLFTEQDLQRNVAPLLEKPAVRTAIRSQASLIQGLEGIGQTRWLASDPLGLRFLILGRMSHLAPAKGARPAGDILLAADGTRVLIVAEPGTSATATDFAKRADRLFADIQAELNRTWPGPPRLILTPVGAYRAALDNESAAKTDTRRAMVFSTVAVAILLLIGFPRPLLGLLALFPALMGTALAYFVLSLFRSSISVLAIGFGGAIISFTVDYGITYLLFLDRTRETRGLDTTREVWSLGLLAMMTTAVSFAFLFLSGFPALAQLGAFAALGVVFTFAFVHLVYPFLFPVVPPAGREGTPWLRRFSEKLASADPAWKPWAALALCLALLPFARLDFQVDLKSLNTVRPETLAAEDEVKQAWGDILNRVYLLSEGKTYREMREKGDRLTALLDEELARGTLSAAFVASMAFPGPERAAANRLAWQAFWTTERKEACKHRLGEAAAAEGFRPWTFDPFLRQLESPAGAAVEIPASLYGMVGIAPAAGTGPWRQFVTVLPGPAYRGEDFFNRLHSSGLARLFDPGVFTERLGRVILEGFLQVALIVGLLTLLVAALYLLDLRLTLIALTPTAFALICTLGTLHLIGRPPGIPTIMVSAVIIGMGTDYAMYIVRSQQRYLDEKHPSMALVRLSVLLSFATTFLGFGVLALASHAMLSSAGIALALGIGYSFLGTTAIVPPLLRRLYRPIALPEETVEAGSKNHARRVLARYRRIEGYVRAFVFFKLRLDPMFPRLASFVSGPRRILDIGCGYGIPSSWLLEIHPDARVFGIDPDSDRVRVASRAIGGRGEMTVGKAPNLPSLQGPVDTALLLDVVHMLDDGELRLTLDRIAAVLEPGGVLVLRAIVPAFPAPSPERRFEERRLKRQGGQARFRTVEEVRRSIEETGLRVGLPESMSPDREVWWFIARKPREYES